MSTLKLCISKEVDSETEECIVHTPANGVSVTVLNFDGEAAYTTNAAVKLVWKYDHATEAEEILWSIKGSGHAPTRFDITDADGVRKLAVCLDNGETGSIFMSGFAEVEEN